MVAGDCNGLAPGRLGICKAAHHIGGTPTCRQANDKIVSREPTFPQVARTKLLAILGTFDCLDKRRLASGNEPDNQIGRYAKRGRALRSIEHAQAAAGSSAHVKDAPAALECLSSPVDCCGNLRQHFRDRLDGTKILIVHRGDDLQRRHRVEIHRSLVSLFGRELR